MPQAVQNPPMPPGFTPDGADASPDQSSQPTVDFNSQNAGPPMPPGFVPEGSDQPDQTLPILKDQQDQEQKPQGFIGEFEHNIGSGLTGLKDSAEKMAGYLGGQLGIGQPSMTDQQQQDLYKAQDENKSRVYKQFRQNFKDKKYAEAISGLGELFDRKYDDPNDPVSQMVSAQWDSSMTARARMLDAMKDNTLPPTQRALAVMQHAAGILPIASQVDEAMERYAKHPTRENLADIVASALPAFIPSLYRGAKAIAQSGPMASTLSSLKATLPPGLQAPIDTAKNAFGGASHVYDPATGTLSKTEDIGEVVTPRQDIGESVQQAADTVQSKLGQDVGAAKARAAAVPLPGGTSTDFMQDMLNIADEVDKHMIDSDALGPGEMSKVKKLVDEISGKPLDQKDFQGYAKRIDSEISKTEAPGADKQVGRMYTKVKQALQKEYYSQIALSDPQVAKALQDANHAYAGITERLERGAAKRAFGADSPEMIAKQVQSGGITETKADAIMQTLKEADQLTPRVGGSYVNDFRRSVLYQQTMKYATKMKGVVVRMDSPKMLEELDKNPTFRHVYGDQYNDIYESVKADAQKQMFQQTAKKVAVGTALVGAGYAAKNHIIHLLGGLIGGQ